MSGIIILILHEPRITNLFWLWILGCMPKKWRRCWTASFVGISMHCCWRAWKSNKLWSYLTRSQPKSNGNYKTFGWRKTRRTSKWLVTFYNVNIGGLGSENNGRGVRESLSKILPNFHNLFRYCTLDRLGIGWRYNSKWWSFRTNIYRQWYSLEHAFKTRSFSSLLFEWLID